jgi:hypothetical protein
LRAAPLPPTRYVPTAPPHAYAHDAYACAPLHRSPFSLPNSFSGIDGHLSFDSSPPPLRLARAPPSLSRAEQPHSALCSAGSLAPARGTPNTSRLLAPAMRAHILILGLLLAAWPVAHGRSLKQGERRRRPWVPPQLRRCRQLALQAPKIPAQPPSSRPPHAPPLFAGLLGGSCGTVNPDDFCSCCADKGGSDSDDTS